MKALLSFAALAVTALAMQSLPLKAQDATSTSGSTSSSSSSSGSTSGSRSSSVSGTSGNAQQQRTNQRTNQTTNNTIPITLNTGTGSGAGNGTNGANAVDPAGANGANGTNGGGFSNNPPFYSQSDVTVRTTPTVYAPPVSGGNPCTLAVSGGVSVIGWGAAAGGTFVDQDCASRQRIAMVHNAGQQAAARELMCLDRDTYNAFKRVGQPCVFNAAFEPAGAAPAPMVQPQPPPVTAPAPMAAKEYPRCNPRLGINDNCRS